MKSNILKIIIVDSNEQLHEGYRFFFETYLDYSLSGLYVSINDALLDYNQVLPDIIIYQVPIIKVNAIQGIRFFRKKDAAARIIMMDEDPDFERVKKAFKNGASGYLTSPVDCERLHKALDSIKYEGATMSNDIVKKIISNFHGKSYQFFSERENEIIDYLCKGATYRVIAEKLFVTTSTINFHIQNIYLKLNVNSKSEALMKLREL